MVEKSQIWNLTGEFDDLVPINNSFAWLYESETGEVPKSKFKTKLTITKDGDSYLIETYSGGYRAKTKQYLTTYKEGAFSFGNSLISDVKYSKSQDKLFWGGEVYERKK